MTQIQVDDDILFVIPGSDPARTARGIVIGIDAEDITVLLSASIRDTLTIQRKHVIRAARFGLYMEE